MVLKNFNLRRGLLMCIDMLVVILSCLITTTFINEFNLTGSNLSVIEYMPKIIVFALVSVCTMAWCGVYENMWKYAQTRDFMRCFIGMTCGYILSVIIFMIYSTLTGEDYSKIYFLVSYFIAVFGVLITRTGYSWVYGFHIHQMKNVSDKKATLIVGAGNAAQHIIGEMLESECQYNPVCIVDDDANKLNCSIRNVKVCGGIDDIPDLCEKNNIEVILIAIPSCDEETKKRIINISSKTNCEIKTLPYLHEMIDVDDNLLEQARGINVEELLGRDVIRFDNTNVKALVQDRICMVTGGGGSIGSELCRQIAKYKPKQLIIVDIYENNAYDIQQELIRDYGDKLNLNTKIASVRDYQKMEMLFEEYHPQLVFHAAAHKHVPLMETNPEEAVKNNIVGTYNVSALADLYKVEKFVLISTDKAVNPTNVMGATKRCCEMIVQDMAQKAKKTQFITVRFGNVLGSNGSVIPLFENQIAKGGPVTVTHPDIIRYFMTIPEAVSLILQAASEANGGEIFVLDMGEPVKILSLAENLIKMHGKKPYKDIKIAFTGLRPGEKLYEELLMSEEGLTETSNKKIFIGKQIEVNEKELLNSLEVIRRLANANDKESVVALLQKIVPTFHHKVNG